MAADQRSTRARSIAIPGSALKSCAQCKAEFTPTRSDQIYCSHNCNVAAYLERGDHKAERRAYMRKRYKRNRLPMLKKQKELRALDPDGWNRRYLEWLHRSPQRMKDYSLRNSDRVKALRKAARDLPGRDAEIAALRVESLKTAQLRRMLAIYFKLHPKADDSDALKIFKASVSTIGRARIAAGAARKAHRPKSA